MDNIIPARNIEELETYLRFLDNHPDEIDSNIFDGLLAQGIAYKNNVFISILNNFIREHKIRTTKEGILNQVYFSKPECELRELLLLLGVGNTIDFSGEYPLYRSLMRDSPRLR